MKSRPLDLRTLPFPSEGPLRTPKAYMSILFLAPRFRSDSMQIRKRFENDSIRPRTFLMNVLIGARNGASRHDSASPVVDLTLVTIISFPCQFCAPILAHVLAVHLPGHYDLTSASRALQRAQYVNMDSIGSDSILIRKRFESETRDSVRKCVSRANSSFSIIRRRFVSVF